MKKLLALAGIALIAAACTNNDEPVQNADRLISLWKTPLLLKSK